LRRDVYEAHPWASRSLTIGFNEAKRAGLSRLKSLGTLAVGLPWLASELDDVEALFGGDAFPYGFDPNRRVLDTTISHLREQGLLVSAVEADALFAPETIDLDLAS
jgi:4,5-dihydroxyphthalate decarboxylase